MSENWKQIPEHRAYDASDLGRVRSWKTWNGHPTPRILSPGIGSKGYLTVRLDGRTLKVHTLIMRTFVGPRPDDLEIRHIDSNPANNALANLAYGTYGENLADKIALKTHCKNGHLLSGENMYYRPNSRARACRECLRIADRKRRDKRKAAVA